MAVKKGDKVKVLYEGTFDDGEVFDSSELHENEPLEFVAGEQNVIEGFDNAVMGKELGDEVKIHLTPGEAYGEYDPERKQSIPKDQIPPSITPEVGMVLALAHQHGDHVHQIPAKIIEVNDSEIVVDLNHPMAGKNLNFKIKVIEIN